MTRYTQINTAFNKNDPLLLYFNELDQGKGHTRTVKYLIEYHQKTYPLMGDLPVPNLQEKVEEIERQLNLLREMLMDGTLLKSVTLTKEGKETTLEIDNLFG